MRNGRRCSFVDYERFTSLYVPFFKTVAIGMSYPLSFLQISKFTSFFKTAAMNFNHFLKQLQTACHDCRSFLQLHRFFIVF